MKMQLDAQKKALDQLLGNTKYEFNPYARDGPPKTGVGLISMKARTTFVFDEKLADALDSFCAQSLPTHEAICSIVGRRNSHRF